MTQSGRSRKRHLLNLLDGEFAKVFRRIMIGCWILFGFSVLAIGAGKVGYEIHHGKLETAREAIRISSCWSRSTDHADVIEQAEPDRDEICERMFDELVRPAVSNADVAYNIEIVGGWVAGVLLLWNLGWHIGHSAWLGRSKNQ